MKRFFVICFFLCCCFIHIAAAKVDTLTVYSQAMKKDVNSLVILPDSYPEALTSGRFYRKTSPYYMQDGGGAFYINLGYLF